MIGVDTDADSRKPVTTHEVAVALASNSRPSTASAGSTTVWVSANETPAVSRTTRIVVGLAVEAGAVSGRDEVRVTTGPSAVGGAAACRVCPVRGRATQGQRPGRVGHSSAAEPSTVQAWTSD